MNYFCNINWTFCLFRAMNQPFTRKRSSYFIAQVLGISQKNIEFINQTQNQFF